MSTPIRELFDLSGKTALVTGGSRGLGLQIAEALGEAGARVMLTSRKAGDLEESAAHLKDKGVEAIWIAADLSQPSEIVRVTEDAIARLGGIDILVNNAAIRPNTKISKITLEEWDLVFNTNLKAPFFLSQAVLPGMIKRKWGRIINLGGTDAYWGKVRRAHGVSAKLGLVGLTRAMALEVARFGVTINVVIPGTIDTQRPHPEWYPELKSGYAERLARIPMARLGHPQQVANACLFLASELASFTTAQELFASGGAVPLVRQTIDEYSAEEF
jgi:gluconate 5-dehydrogenase